MNAKQIARLVEATCRDLDSLELLFAYNLPSVTRVRKADQVSWPSVPGSIYSLPFGSLEQYLHWLRQGEFTCLLFDYSMIRASFTCIENIVVEHSLLYWPCPVTFAVSPDSISDLCDGIEMCIESPTKFRELISLSLRTPMRFDFDPEREGDDHPFVHLHSQFEDTRIDVLSPMCFPSFIKRIFRTFYRERIRDISDFDRIHEQPFSCEERKLDPPSNCFQLSWV